MASMHVAWRCDVDVCSVLYLRICRVGGQAVGVQEVDEAGGCGEGSGVGRGYAGLPGVCPVAAAARPPMLASLAQHRPAHM